MHFLFLDAQSLNAKERHIILPLMIATFIMQSITFIALPSQVRTMLLSLTLKDQTHLGAIFIVFLH